MKDSKHQQIKCWDREASLTVPCAYKEDEGFYTIRVPTLDGYNEQSAYVFVRGRYGLLSYLEQKPFFNEVKNSQWSDSPNRMSQKYLSPPVQ